MFSVLIKRETDELDQPGEPMGRNLLDSTHHFLHLCVVRLSNFMNWLGGRQHAQSRWDCFEKIKYKLLLIALGFHIALRAGQVQCFLQVSLKAHSN